MVVMANSLVFQDICRDILEPRGVKIGGYREEIFDQVPDEEFEEVRCQICYLIAKDPMRCTNGHLFCTACIFTWSMTGSDNADRCPVCRTCGLYTEDESLTDQLNNYAVKCRKCVWQGWLVDYRSHCHGRDDTGVSPKSAGLPLLRSKNGSIMFPELSHNADFTTSVEASRRKSERNYMGLQLELAEGQARLAFLLDVFEEDLQRHRENMDSLVRLQRRHHADRFEEVMRLESELGQITRNLLLLINSANDDVDSITQRIYDSTQRPLEDRVERHHRTPVPRAQRSGSRLSENTDPQSSLSGAADILQSRYIHSPPAVLTVPHPPSSGLPRSHRPRRLPHRPDDSSVQPTDITIQSVTIPMSSVTPLQSPNRSIHLPLIAGSQDITHRNGERLTDSSPNIRPSFGRRITSILSRPQQSTNRVSDNPFVITYPPRSNPGS